MRQALSKTYTNFVAGLNTDANESMFPDNFTQGEVNFDINTDGTRSRRKGIETAYKVSVLNLSESAQSFFRWQKTAESLQPPGIEGDEIYEFIQDGGYIEVYRILYEGDDLTTLRLTTINMNDYKSDADQEFTDPCTYSSTASATVIFNKAITPLKITISYAGGVEITPISPIVRWFGMSPTQELDKQPTTIPNSSWGLYSNSGWNETEFSGYGFVNGAWPALSQAPSAGWLPNKSTGIEEFSPDQLDAMSPPSKKALKGGRLLYTPSKLYAGTKYPAFYGSIPTKSTITIVGWVSTLLTFSIDSGTFDGDTPEYILVTGVTVQGIGIYGPAWFNGTNYEMSAFKFGSVPNGIQLGALLYAVKEDGIGANPTNLIPTLLSVAESDSIKLPDGTHPACGAFWAGRLWYGNHANQSVLYYSQVLSEEPVEMERCYQAADPTDRLQNEVAADDGGTLTVPQIGRVLFMQELGGTLLLFSNKGIWKISGGQGGFSADSFSVEKVSTLALTSVNGIRDIDGDVIFTTEDSIWIASYNQYHELEFTNILLGKVSNLYRDISNKDKTCLGYDPIEKIAYLSYGSNTVSGGDKILLWNKRFDAFTRYEIFSEKANPTVISCPHSVRSPTGKTSMRFISRYGHTDTGQFIAQFTNEGWKDYGTTDAAAYILTGADTLHDKMRYSNISYLFFYMKKTEDLLTDNPSSLLVRLRWDNSNTDLSGDWGREIQAYRHKRVIYNSDGTHNTGRSVVTSRHRARGYGRTLQLYLRTEPDRDCQIQMIALEGSTGVAP